MEGEFNDHGRTGAAIPAALATRNDSTGWSSIRRYFAHVFRNVALLEQANSGVHGSGSIAHPGLLVRFP
jgi:hypothetical protein